MAHEHHNHAHDHSHEHEHHVHSADVHTEHCGCGCGAEHGDSFEKTKKAELARLIISAVLFAAGRIIEEAGLLPEFAANILFAASYVITGFVVVREAAKELLHGRVFGECFLMSVASLGAFAIGEYGEGCAVMLLYSAGEYIQGAVLSKSRARIRALSDEHGFEHSHSNSDTERFISKFARIYTPVICGAAILIAVIPPVFMSAAWKTWIYKGLSALVIGCPCAIVISVPLVFACAIGACTKKGIFVHCSDALEKLHKNGYAEEIVITDGSAQKLDFAKRAAKKAYTIALENIAAAIAIKAAVLVLVIFMEREIPMWLAEFSDAGVAVLAVLNSLRALRVK